MHYKLYHTSLGSAIVILSVCLLCSCTVINQVNVSENNITTNYPRHLVHCTTLLIDLTLGEHIQFWVKDEGVCRPTKVAFAIQNQRYLWNEAAYSQSCYTVSIETRVRPIDWWHICWPMVEVWPTYLGSKIFPRRLRRTLFSERHEIWHC